MRLVAFRVFQRIRPESARGLRRSSPDSAFRGLPEDSPRERERPPTEQPGECVSWRLDPEDSPRERVRPPTEQPGECV